MTIKEPRLAFEPPETKHCPGCDGCGKPVPHCEREGFCCPYDAGDFDPDECACQCVPCRSARAGVPQCDDEAEHRECSKHAEPRDTYDPDDSRYLRRQS